jgi:hypothetical protein
MKIDTVYFMIAVAIGLMLSYGLWSMAGELATFIAIGSVVYLCITLGMALGVRHENPRARTNLSIASILFFIIGLAINVGFCFAGNIPVIYLMVSAISFLIYLAAVNFIHNAKQ